MNHRIQYTHFDLCDSQAYSCKQLDGSFTFGEWYNMLAKHVSFILLIYERNFQFGSNSLLVVSQDYLVIYYRLTFNYVFLNIYQWFLQNYELHLNSMQYVFVVFIQIGMQYKKYTVMYYVFELIYIYIFFVSL